MAIMDTRSKLRRANTLALLKKSELKKKEFAALIDVAPTYLGQMIKGSENGGRDIGNTVAPRIESAFKKPKGWLDQDHSGDFSETPTMDEILKQIEALPPEQQNKIALKVINQNVSLDSDD